MRSGGAKKKDGPTSRRILRFVACSRKKGPERAFEPQEMTCARALRGQREGARCGGAGLKNPGPKMEDQKERELPPAPGNHTRLWCVEGSWSGVSLVGVCLGWAGWGQASPLARPKIVPWMSQHSCCCCWLAGLIGWGPGQPAPRRCNSSAIRQGRAPRVKCAQGRAIGWLHHGKKGGLSLFFPFPLRRTGHSQALARCQMEAALSRPSSALLPAGLSRRATKTQPCCEIPDGLGPGRLQRWRPALRVAADWKRPDFPSLASCMHGTYCTHTSTSFLCSATNCNDTKPFAGLEASPS